jgi:hypothetical protein
MKATQLKSALDEFILLHGDGEVKILWEEGVFLEGFNAEYLEDPTDIRCIADWALPGESLIVKNENPDKMFVLLYGDGE